MSTTIRALLVDDEQDSREVLRNLLNKHAPFVEICGQAANVEEAYNKILSEKPQLLFLDIEMPKADGFSLLRKFDTVDFVVIFVSGFEQYAITAIRFNALDYLLKPVEVAELKEAVAKAAYRVSINENNSAQVNNLLQSLSKPEDQKIAVHDGSKVKMLSIRTILYIEADRRYSRIFTSGKEQYTVTRSLTEFEEYFGSGSKFVRISRGVLINAAFIKEYSKGTPFLVILENGMDFEIPRRKKSEVLTKIRNARNT